MFQEEREEEAEVARGAKGFFLAAENIELGPGGEPVSHHQSQSASPPNAHLQTGLA